MSTTRSLAHSAWLAMLALLLGLAPFIHGHLGQPLLHGWHVHPQAAAAAQPSDAGVALQQPEAVDIEVAPGIMPARLQQIAPAAAFAAGDIPTLPAFHRDPPAAPSAAGAFAWPATVEAAASRLHPGLPPPAQAPPSFLSA